MIAAYGIDVIVVIRIIVSVRNFLGFICIAGSSSGTQSSRFNKLGYAFTSIFRLGNVALKSLVSYVKTGVENRYERTFPV